MAENKEEFELPKELLESIAGLNELMSQQQDQAAAMMYNWGMYADGESGFNEEEQKLYDKLERIFTPLQKEKNNAQKVVEFFKEISNTYENVSYYWSTGTCIKFIDYDKTLCFDTKKTKYTDVVLEVSKIINKLKLKKRED